MKKTKPVLRKPVVYTTPFPLLFLAACGGSSGTSSSSNNGGIQTGPTESFSGFVIKGPLSKATVFADYDGDGVRSDDEPFALTNEDGSYNLNAVSNFSSIVVTTDSNTIDTSSGAVLEGVTLKAPKGANVVSPTSTMVVESNLSVDQVATALGLPEGFTLDFNPFATDADPEMANAVEKTSQMVMTTVNAITASGEGVGLSKLDAFKTAMEAVVDVVKTNADKKTKIDFADTKVLDEIQSKAVEVAVEKGASETAIKKTLQKAIETTKTVNLDIKNLEDVFSETAKNIFKSTSKVNESAKIAAEEVSEDLSSFQVAVSSPNLSATTPPSLQILSIAQDNIINATEKANGFIVKGVGQADSIVEVSFGSVIRKVTVGKDRTWEADFTFTTPEKIELSSNFPTQINAIISDGSSVIMAKKAVEVNTTAPTVTINSIGGDNRVNIAERDAGLSISGTTNANAGSELKVSLLKASDDSVFSNYGSYSATVQAEGKWDVILPSKNFPTENFKVKAEVTNTIGNTNSVASSEIPVDFKLPSITLTDSTSGVATDNITYRVTFDEAVTLFDASSLKVTNGTVASFSQVGNTGKLYDVVISPSTNAQGNITFAVPSGSAKNSAGNINANFTSSAQAFDTKAPSVSTISILETGTNNEVTKVSKQVDIKVTLSESVTGFNKSDVSVSSGTIESVTQIDNSNYKAVYKPTSNIDSNVTFTVSGGGYQDSVGNSGLSSSKIFGVDTKSPTSILTLPSGSFGKDQNIDFKLTHNESISVTGGDPFIIMDIGERVRLAEKIASSDSSVLNFRYTVKNNDLDTNGISIIATTGLSKSEHTLSGTFNVGDKITVTGASKAFSVVSGAETASKVAIGLRTFLNSDSSFKSAGFKAASMGSGKLAIVGTNAENSSFTLSSGAAGSYSKDVSKSYTAAIKDIYGNVASPTFSLSGDPSGITVDGGSSGVGVDGYLKDVNIYSDNDEDGTLNFGDSTATTNSTGVFKFYGAEGPLVMKGGVDKATGLSFDVQYEAPAGYSIINPITSIVRSLETMDTGNSDRTTSSENIVKAAIGANVSLKDFDAYNSVSDDSAISNAISYQKAAASIALVVDIGSTGFIELVKKVENDGNNTTNVNTGFKIKDQANPFTTQNASEKIFDAIANYLKLGAIENGSLKTFGSTSGTIEDITIKIVDILSPTAIEILGVSNFSNYRSALENEAKVLAAGVARINGVGSGSLNKDTAVDALTKIVQTQQVWQGDANAALEDNNPNNNWLDYSSTIPGNVTFDPVDDLGKSINGDYTKLNTGGYRLQIDGKPIDSSTHQVNWYKVVFSDTTQDNKDSLATAPIMTLDNNTVFASSALYSAAGGTLNESANTKKKKGLTFEIKLKSDNSIVLAKTDAPVFRADNFLLNEDVDANIFTWGGLADGAQVGIVVPTSYKINSASARDQFEGGDNGSGAEYSFTVTRKGNLAQAQQIDYEVIGTQTVNASDFSENKIPSGTIKFAAQDDSETITIKLNNDTSKEGPEGFTVKLKDTNNTSQLLEDTVSFSIKDDDPTNPLLTSSSSSATRVVAEDINNTTSLDFDYFDTSAKFNISIQSFGQSEGSGSILLDGSAYDLNQGTNNQYTFTQVQNVLSNISFKGKEGQTSGAITVNVKDIERKSSGEQIIKYEIRNKPQITKDNDPNTQFTVGKFSKLSGLKVSDVDSQDLFVKLNVDQSKGGSISLENSTKAILDIFENGSGAEIFGKSGDVNAVLSSLKFSPIKNQASGTISISVDDLDSDTEIVSESVEISNIQAAAPEISFPSSKINVKAQKASDLKGIEVSDIDSDIVTLNINAPSGEFSGINSEKYQVTGLGTNTISITGSPAAINLALKGENENEGLKYKGIQGAGNIQLKVSAVDQGGKTSENISVNLTVLDNQPPAPGGDLTFKPGGVDGAKVEEDSSDTMVRFEIPKANLINEDGATPTQIRIVKVEGGTLKLGGSEIKIGDGATKIDLEEVSIGGNISSYKKDFTFSPSADRTNDAFIEYVVVDPVLDTANSLPSKGKIEINPVNDSPSISGSTDARQFNENDLGLILDRSFSIKDKDSINLSEVILELSNVQSGDKLLYSTEFWDEDTSQNGKIILTSNTNQFGKSISIFEQAVRSVKFNNPSDSPNTSETRVIKIKVKDADVAATSKSDSKNKLSNEVTFNLNVVGKNDIPSISSSGDISYNEGSGEGLIFANASIADPDNTNDNIIPKKAIIKIIGGYRIGEDFISLKTGYTIPSGFIATFNAEDGTYTIENSSSSSATMSDLENVLKKVVYTNNSQDPSKDNRDLSITIVDDQEASSNILLKKIAVSPLNDNPTIDLDGLEGSVKKGQDVSTPFIGSVHTKGAQIAPRAKIEDPDGSNLSKLVVSITNPVSDNNSSGVADTLALFDQGSNLIKANNLSSTFSVNNTVLTIEGNAAITIYEELLQNIVFKSHNNPATNNRDISIEIIDVDKLGATGKTSKKLDSDGNVISGTQASTIKIQDNPIAIVNTGTKILTLNGNPEGASQIFVDLGVDLVATDFGAEIEVPSSIGDPVHKALNVDASAVTRIGTEIFGTIEDNILTGSDQDDIISGAGGADTIDARAGNDIVDYQTSAIQIDGGSGNDTLFVFGNDNLNIDLTEVGSSTNQVKIFVGENLTEPSGKKVVNFEDVDASQSTGSVTIIGTDSDSSISLNMNTFGGKASDNITTGSGSDTVFGGDGNDVIIGKVGNDNLYGETGEDTLIGGVGADNLYGGEGFDTFDFSSVEDLIGDSSFNLDTIKDLEIGDKILLSSQHNWLGLNSDPTSPPTSLTDENLDAYIQKINNNYLLVIEKSATSGGEKGYVDLGNQKPFEPSKWSVTQTNLTKTITVVDNNTPTMDLTKTSIDTPLTIGASGIPSGLSSAISTINPHFSISDTDGDKLFVTLEATNGEIINGNSKVSSLNIGSQNSSERVAIDEINSILSTLSFSGTTRGSASMKLTVSDGFAQESGTIFFSVPNTAPSIEVPSEQLSGQIGGNSISLSSIGFSDVDVADNASSAKNMLEISTTSGSFSPIVPSNAQDTGQTFDHDDNNSTNALPIKSFSLDSNTYYFIAKSSENEEFLEFLSPENANDLSLGFLSSNLSISGIGEQFLSLEGNLASIKAALSIIGLKGRDAEIANLSVQAFDDLDLVSEKKTFQVNFDLGTPKKPTVQDGIASGVSLEELQGGFQVSVDIKGTGVKAGNQLKLLVSKDSGSFQELATSLKILNSSEVETGVINFLITDDILPSQGTYVFKAQLENSLPSEGSSDVILDFTRPEQPTLSLVADSSSELTDTGTSSLDNITKNNKPTINLVAENGIDKEKIFLDISDGEGASVENRGENSDLFTVGTVEKIEVDGTETGQSIYPITFNKSLSDGDYGFFLVDASGNKTVEARKISIQPVDKYDHYIPESDSSTQIQSYLIEMPSNFSVQYFIKQTDGSITNPLTELPFPTIKSDGFDFKISYQDLKELVFDQGHSLTFRITDNSGVGNSIFLSETDTLAPVLSSSNKTYWKSSGWFTIDTSIPEGVNGNAGELILSDFSDIGTLSSDFKTNDKEFSLDIQNQENNSKILFQLDDGSGFNSTSEIQSIPSDGIYKYRAIVSDQAGNINNTETVTVEIETTTPVMTALNLGETDTGISTTDRISNLKKPIVQFNSETGLRVFIEKINQLGLKSELVTGSDFSFTDDGKTTASYEITFSDNLEDGSYNVITEDLFGNQNIVSHGNTDQSFVIDTTFPSFSEINLIQGTDRGKDTTDRYTSVKKPVINFSSELGLNLFIDQNIAGTISSLAAEKFTVQKISNLPFEINANYLEESGKAKEVSFSVLSTFEGVLSDKQLSDSGMILTVRGLNSETGLYDLENLDRNNDGKYTIILPPGETRDLDEISSVQVDLSSGSNLIHSQFFSTNPSKYQVDSDILIDGKTLGIEVRDIFSDQIISDLANSNLSLVVKSSMDGENYTEVIKNGLAFELNDEFINKSHIKLELNDVTDNENIILINENIIKIEDLLNQNNNYEISFSDDLPDGVYTLSIQDDAGNKVLGTNENKQTFTIDSTPPTFPGIISLGETDLGISFEDRLTSNNFPVVSFNSEPGLRVFIDRDNNQIDTNDYSVNYDSENGTYTVTFEDKRPLNPLEDGVYTISIEDDAGNNVRGSSLPFIIETVAPEISTIVLINNTDTGISSSDRLSNKARPEVNFNSEIGLRVVVEYVPDSGSKSFLTPDSDYTFSESEGVYSVSFLKDLGDGVYNIIAEDDAGNRSSVSEEQSFTIDRTQPILPDIVLSNESDTGLSNIDRLTKLVSPDVSFSSEVGLRVFVVEDPLNSARDLVVGVDYVLDIRSEGTSYRIVFLDDLGEFEYSVNIVDDAGNKNKAGSITNRFDTFQVDPTPPEFSSAISLGTDDVGHSNTDRLTGINKPEVSFTAGEPGLTIDVLYDNFENDPVKIDRSKFSVNADTQEYFIEPIFTGSVGSVETIAFNVVSAAGVTLTSEQSSSLNLNLDVKGYNSASSAFDLDNLDTDNNGIFSVSSASSTPELDGISSLQVLLRNADKILETIEFSTNPKQYKLNTGLNGDGKTLDLEVMDVFSKSVITDLSAANLSLKVSGSTDGTSFTETSKNGSNFEFSDEFLNSSHIKVELNDISNAESVLTVDSDTIIKNTLPGYTNNYVINFGSNLNDGIYTVVITDPAGNEVIGNENNHQFEIETVLPTIVGMKLNDGLDLGFSDSDMATTVQKPDFSFNSENGVRTHITRVVDGNSPEIMVDGTHYNLIEDTDFSFFTVEFIDSFPDNTQGFYHVRVEDKAGNENSVSVVPTSIRVDNVAPVLQAAKIDETGRLVILEFSEELDTRELPTISDFEISLSNGLGETNTININDAQYIKNNSGKTDIVLSLDLPIFKDDQYTLSFATDQSVNYADLVGKTFQDPGSVSINNNSDVVRSSGKVIDGYIKDAQVFHDLNMDGVRDVTENSYEFSTVTNEDGSFSGLRGDILKPLVSVGGTDIITGLSFASKVGLSTIPVTLYSTHDAKVITPLTSLIYQLSLKDAPKDLTGLKLSFDESSLSISTKLDGTPVTTDTHKARLVLSNSGTELQNIIEIDTNSLTEQQIFDLLTENNISSSDFDSMKIAVYDSSADLSVDAALASTESFTNFTNAQQIATRVEKYSISEATELVKKSFGITATEIDFFNYDPIANNNLDIQALSAQIGNLLIVAPNLISTLQRGSEDVFQNLTTFVSNFKDGDEVINLGSQVVLETLFGVDNSEPVGGGPRPDLFKGLAQANTTISSATTIQAQAKGQFEAQDIIIENRENKDLSLLDPDHIFTDLSERIFGSNDDDIVFGAGGNDLFGGNDSISLMNEGDTFIGGDGNDIAIVSGSVKDYVFMTETTGSMRYDTVEMMLSNGANLGGDQLLVMQKAVGSNGLIAVQAENIRFSEDSVRLSFDKTDGSIKGSAFNDVIKGTHFGSDNISGEVGNDVLIGFGAPNHGFDTLDGGLGNDTIVTVGSNVKARGGEGNDTFGYIQRSDSSNSDGNLIIEDFNASDDVLDLSMFKKDQAIVLTDLVTNAAEATVDGKSGVKISFNDWKLNDNETGTGYIFLENAVKEDSIIKDSQGNELTDSNLDISSGIDLSTLVLGDLT